MKTSTKNYSEKEMFSKKNLWASFTSNITGCAVFLKVNSVTCSQFLKLQGYFFSMLVIYSKSGVFKV